MSRTSAFLFRRLRIVLALESLKAFFEVEQTVQGIAADLGVEASHRSAVVDLQEFNESFRLRDVSAHPNARVHPETSLKLVQVLVDHTQCVFDLFQDLLPRASSIAIGAFQFIDLSLEAASPLSAQPPSRSAGERQKHLAHRWWQQLYSS